MGIDEIINAIVSIDDLDLEELKGIKIKVEPEKSIIKECRKIYEPPPVARFSAIKKTIDCIYSIAKQNKMGRTFRPPHKMRFRKWAQQRRSKSR